MDNLWRIKNPKTIRVGDYFLAGRLKKGDLFLCVRHTGDCFQEYVYIKECYNCLYPEPQFRFGSYGIGNAIRIKNITPVEIAILKAGGRIEKNPCYDKIK